MAGLISGGQTVAVALQEALDGDRVTTGTVVATRAGTWGLGVYLQTSDNRCAASLCLPAEPSMVRACRCCRSLSSRLPPHAVEKHVIASWSNDEGGKVTHCDQ